MIFNLFDPGKKRAGQDHYLATTKLFEQKSRAVVLLAEYENNREVFQTLCLNLILIIDDFTLEGCVDSKQMSICVDADNADERKWTKAFPVLPESSYDLGWNDRDCRRKRKFHSCKRSSASSATDVLSSQQLHTTNTVRINKLITMV